MKNESQPLTNQEAAKLIAYSDQIGYHIIIDKDGNERVVPVNPRLQVIFERALWRLRQK